MGRTRLRCSVLEKGGVVVVVLNGPPLGVQLACLIGSPKAWRPAMSNLPRRVRVGRTVERDQRY